MRPIYINLISPRAVVTDAFIGKSQELLPMHDLLHNDVRVSASGRNIYILMQNKNCKKLQFLCYRTDMLTAKCAE